MKLHETNSCRETVGSNFNDKKIDVTDGKSLIMPLADLKKFIPQEELPVPADRYEFYHVEMCRDSIFITPPFCNISDKQGFEIYQWAGIPPRDAKFFVYQDSFLEDISDYFIKSLNIPYDEPVRLCRHVYQQGSEYWYISDREGDVWITESEAKSYCKTH